MNELIDVLKIPYAATIESQKEGYGLSDFYISWLRMQKGLGRVENSHFFDLASKLLTRLDQRAPSLFKTPLMLCAIYLDPRINFKLSHAQKRDAALQLITIQERILALNAKNVQQTINDTLDEIQAEYCLQDGEQVDGNTSAFLESLAKFETEKVPIKHPVTQFWEINRHKYPLIYPLAEVLHSVPANQCCTERSFSSFSFLRSAHRRSMDPKNVSNLLTIRLNKDIFNDYRKQYVQNILNS